MLLYKPQKKRENTSYQAYRVGIDVRNKVMAHSGFLTKKERGAAMRH